MITLRTDHVTSKFPHCESLGRPVTIIIIISLYHNLLDSMVMIPCRSYGGSLKCYRPSIVLKKRICRVVII